MQFHCQIFPRSNAEHLSQIFTGFSLLARDEKVFLDQKIDRYSLNNNISSEDYSAFNLKVMINGEIRVMYDLHDWDWIDEDELNNCHYYFKRSYDKDVVAGYGENHKIFPLGLNYQVTGNFFDPLRIKRILTFGKGMSKIKDLIKAANLDSFLPEGEVEKIHNIEAAASSPQSARILFLVRVWDPNGIEDKTQKQTVIEMNDRRVEYIKQLRSEFGPQFLGGLSHDEFSRTAYPKFLIEDAALGNKRNFLETVKHYPICIATTGLNRSNGWKLGEYVAMSRAILTEPLEFEVPGDFSNNKNYLEFTSVDELITNAHKLIDDEELRFNLMQANFEYYRDYLRPDRLVWNTLKIVAEKEKLSL